MSGKAPEMEESIRLALEAAQAATDAAGEIGPMQHGIEIAVMRVENLRKFTLHSMIASLGASVVILALAALMYFQTLSNLRMATATQIDATAVVTSSIEQIDLALGRTETLVAEIKELDALEGRLADRLAEVLTDVDETVAAETSVQTVAVVKAALDKESSDIAAMLTDMEMALAKLISTGFGVPATAMPQTDVQSQSTPAAKPDPAPVATPRPSTSTAKTTSTSTTSKTTSSSSAADSSNPFRYP